MTRCENCENIAELTKYDDTVQDDDGSCFPGYHHGWMLCKSCSEKFNYQTLQVYEESFKEREYLKNEGYDR